MQHKAGVRITANALRIPPCLAHPPQDDFIQNQHCSGLKPAQSQYDKHVLLLFASNYNKKVEKVRLGTLKTKQPVAGMPTKKT